jgi:nitrite reductase (NADH) small subunit
VLEKNRSKKNKPEQNMTEKKILIQNKNWLTVCKTSDLIKDSGISALVEQGVEDRQVAIFYLPNSEKQVYAVSNYDPIGEANVLYRGIVGSVGDDIVVSSPLYKQHFCLTTGKCLQEDTSIDVLPARILDEHVQLFVG